MFKKTVFLALVIVAILLLQSVYAEGDNIRLPVPDTKGGKPLMEALNERKSERDFSPEPLQENILSDLLWAAAGINRPESGLRTSPTARNCQEIDIYVALVSGLYIYEPKANSLIKISSTDIRQATGKQPFVKDAPVNLIFVLDKNKAANLGDKADFYAACDTGYISQNVYLYCASAGLATVARGWFDEKELSSAMGLGEDKKIVLTQTVGYRK
ncbi:MAG TPA: SagB/ThcOx family dehydrogenase [Candidatus Omnitrophota bacterium]|nr:SagB/ThcOx family dehydrogenase [Candidatus Omnitrophota bacterium]